MAGYKTGWADALKEALKIVRSEPEMPGEPDPETLAAMEFAGPVDNARAACRATKKSIEKRILELAR